MVQVKAGGLQDCLVGDREPSVSVFVLKNNLAIEAFIGTLIRSYEQRGWKDPEGNSAFNVFSFLSLLTFSILIQNIHQVKEGLGERGNQREAWWL